LFIPGITKFSLSDSYTFSEMLISFGSLLFQFGSRFLILLANLDMFNPFHLAFAVLILLIGLGIRPSYIGEGRVGMLHDLSTIKRLMLAHPLYFILVLAVLYALSIALFLLKIPLYVLLFAFFGWLALIAIFAILLAHFVVFVIRTSDGLPSFKRFLPFFIPIISYAILRSLFLLFPSNLSNSVSLLSTILITLVGCALLIKMERTRLDRTRTSFKDS
jgi:hypothetical protein